MYPIGLSKTSRRTKIYDPGKRLSSSALNFFQPLPVPNNEEQNSDYPFTIEDFLPSPHLRRLNTSSNLFLSVLPCLWQQIVTNSVSCVACPSKCWQPRAYFRDERWRLQSPLHAGASPRRDVWTSQQFQLGWIRARDVESTTRPLFFGTDPVSALLFG